jgi:ABC-type branched-subunit amino acid transport system substrate-binding protein
MSSALLDHLEGLGRSKVAFVIEGGPLGAALQNARARRLQTAPVVSPESADWLEVVLASDAEAVLCDADPVTAGEVIAALRNAGWAVATTGHRHYEKGIFLGGPALAASDFVAVAGQAAEGAVFVTPYPFPADVPGGADFVAAYQAISNGVPPGPLALPAYEATWLLLEALEQEIAAHREPTRTGIESALPAAERDGLLGHIVFNAGQTWGDAPLYWYRIGMEGVPQHVPTPAP